jgi:hypothetical protein
MGKINWGRVVLGGLLAGIVLNVFDFIVNGWLLSAQWNAALQALGKSPMGFNVIVWFVVCDFLIGLWVLWLYAAIRPRYGAGPKTALCAGLAAWFALAFVVNVSQLPMGLFPSSIMYWNMIGWLVAGPLAAVAGASLYQEA